jgi:magnesium-transporting ATPase (P-type)
VAGLWIVKSYDMYVIYPKEAFLYLTSGIWVTFIAFLITKFSKKRVITNKKDNRHYINKVWRNKVEIGNKVVGFLLVILAIIAIFNISFALSLLVPILFLGFITFGFIFIMHEDGNEESWEPSQNKMIRIMLRLIDYRVHPFSIPLILFILIVVTFLLSKQFGFTLSLKVGGNPRYVQSLPAAMYPLAGLTIICGFMYFIQQEDFFGIKQARQSMEKLVAIHFMELIICGSTFLIWLITVVEALFMR